MGIRLGHDASKRLVFENKIRVVDPVCLFGLVDADADGFFQGNPDDACGYGDIGHHNQDR